MRINYPHYLSLSEEDEKKRRHLTAMYALNKKKLPIIDIFRIGMLTIERSIEQRLGMTHSTPNAEK